VKYVRIGNALEVGGRAIVVDGLFKGAEGTVGRIVEERGLVEVVLVVFDRPTPVELEYWQVERTGTADQ
jgi:transcriptional antiterminator NusG